jgi:hypothetical protein
MATPERVINKMKELGLSGVNKPKKTPSHKTKSHVVMAKEGNTYKVIRFGQQGVSGSPKKEGESKSETTRRKSFKARHAKNISKGKMSAAYWSNSEKWAILLPMLSGGVIANVINSGFTSFI